MVPDVRTSLWPGAGGNGSRHGRSGTAGTLTRVAGASVQRDVSADLKIVTKDGDTVTISASLDTTATYASLRQRGGVDARSAQFESQSSLNVQVQGDLSPQEQADIAQVVRRFMQDLHALARGQDASIANVAAGDPQTLKSVAADATTQTTLTAVAVVGGVGSDSPAQPLISTGEGTASPPDATPTPAQARGMAGPLPVSTPPVLETATPAAA